MSYISRQIHTRHVVAPSVRLQVVIVTLPVHWVEVNTKCRSVLQKVSQMTLFEQISIIFDFAK